MQMIYLDNSATTRQDPKVTEIMKVYMEESFGNPSSLHHPGLLAEKAIKKSRAHLADIICRGEGEIVFTSGGTEANNMALFGAARARRRMGNRIVTSAVEHPAILECISALEEEGFEVVKVGVDRNCRIDMEAMKAAIDDRTILVSVMHVNNEVGTVMPVDEIADIIAKATAPALLHSDCVQSFCKIPLPKKADLISVSGHKIHGPKGSGALWIREGARIKPLIYGGGQEKGLRSGTENVPAIAGLGLAAEIMGARGDANYDKVRSLRDRLVEALGAEIDEIVINSPEDASPYIVNVSFPRTRGEVILHTLEQSGIYVSTGSACSSNKKGRSHVLEAMGCRDEEIEGAIRFSLSHMNTMEEIEEAAARTAEAVSRFRMLGSLR